MTRIQATIAALSTLLLVTACAHEKGRSDTGASARAASAAAKADPNTNVNPNTPTYATGNTNANSNPNANATPNSNPNPNSNSNSNSNPNAMPNSNSDANANRDMTASAPATAAAPTSGEIQGRVEQVDRSDNLVISGSERAGLAFDHFKADDRTEVTIGGKKASLADVEPGDEVRASFSGQGDALHVDKLQVTPKSSADDQAPAKSGDEKK
jgi:hypothetical protein